MWSFVLVFKMQILKDKNTAIHRTESKMKQHDRCVACVIIDNDKHEVVYDLTLLKHKH